MEMNITSKGQVTIPAHMRDKYGFELGGKADFVDMGDHVAIFKPKTQDNARRVTNFRKALEEVKKIPTNWDELFASLGVSNTDEYIDLMRGRDRNDPGLNWSEDGGNTAG